MSGQHTFRAVIQNEGSGGAFVEIPFDVEQAFGKKRVKIKATIDGQPYRGTLVRMGGSAHILIVLKEIREKIGKTFGDEIEIVLEEDTEPRAVVLPEDVSRALENDPAAAAFFQKLSYTHQRQYLQWIEEAKREQTRQERIGRMIELLRQGKKDH